MARAMGIKKVWVEMDSSKCLNLILHDQGQMHSDVGLLTEVKALLARDWITKITYGPRSCNYAVDYLVKRGLREGHGYHEIY